MSYTPKFKRQRNAGLGDRMKKSHSFGAIADLGLTTFSIKTSRSKKTLNLKEAYSLPDAGVPASRTVSDDGASIDSLDFDAPTFRYSSVCFVPLSFVRLEFVYFAYSPILLVMPEISKDSN